MKLHLEWLPPISLKDGAKDNLIYTCQYESLPHEAGIYIFGRRHGAAFEALYVGKATSLNSRIRQQFNNVKLMKHVQNALNGERILLLGLFKSLSGQQDENCLPIMERALIRHFLERDDDIVNVHGTRLKTHEIVSEGSAAKHAIPSKIVVDQ